MKKIREILISIGFIFNFILRNKSLLILLNILHMGINTILPFVNIVFFKFFFDSVQEKKEFNYLILIIIIFSAANIVLFTLKDYINYKLEVGYKIIQLKMIEQLSSKIVEMDYYIIEKSNMQDKINLCRDYINDGILQKVIDLFNNLITNIITIIGIIYIIRKIDLVILIIILIFTLINSYFNAKSQNSNNKFMESTKNINRKCNYIHDIMVDFSYGKELRLYNVIDFLSEKYTILRKQFFKIKSSMFFDFEMPNIISNITGLIQRIYIYVVMIKKYLVEGIQLGDFSGFTMAINQFSDSITNIMYSLKAFDIKSRQIKNIIYFFSETSGNLIKKEEEENKITERILKIESIEFNNVYFRYNDESDYVLNGVSFKIKIGEKIAVVGVNGAGKTTIIKLLMKLYLPCSGEIKINDTNINEIDTHQYILYFSTLFQDYSLFSLMIKDNVNLSDKEFPDSEIIEAIRTSDGYNIIKNLPYGINTYIFRDYDTNGVEFSIGEQQKFALSRAVFKNAPVFILDEPTSALSPIAEAEFYKSINNILKNKIGIFISHRLASTLFCDRILVINEGKVVEDGNSKELLNLNGLYAELFKIQASMYYEK